MASVFMATLILHVLHMLFLIKERGNGFYAREHPHLSHVPFRRAARYCLEALGLRSNRQLARHGLQHVRMVVPSIDGCYFSGGLVEDGG